MGILSSGRIEAVCWCRQVAHTVLEMQGHPGSSRSDTGPSARPSKSDKSDKAEVLRVGPAVQSAASGARPAPRDDGWMACGWFITGGS